MRSSRLPAFSLFGPRPPVAKLPTLIPFSSGQGGAHPQPQQDASLPFRPTGKSLYHICPPCLSASLAPVQPRSGELSSGTGASPPLPPPTLGWALFFLLSCPAARWGLPALPWRGSRAVLGLSCRLFSPGHPEYRALPVPTSNLFFLKLGSDLDSAIRVLSLRGTITHSRPPLCFPLHKAKSS